MLYTTDCYTWKTIEKWKAFLFSKNLKGNIIQNKDGDYYIEIDIPNNDEHIHQLIIQFETSVWI